MKHREFLAPLDIQSHDQAYEILSKGINTQEKQEQLSKALTAVLNAYDESDTRPNAVEVSTILQQLNADADTLIATLLSDPRLREEFDHEAVEVQYGAAITNIVRHIHWLNTFKDCTEESPNAPEEAETLRRMLLATVDDIRAVLAKLAYRLQRLRGLPQEDEAVRRCIARETRDVYVPLVNRLGIAQLKWEMEDLAFRYLDPEPYMTLAKSMEGNRLMRESFIEEFAYQLKDEVAKIGVDAEISGRAKHLYSTWRKMQRKQVEVEEVADLLAVRVIVDTVPQCYMVLGMAHHLWKHLPHEFDDYIANSKGNGYQSIHTAVIGPGGRIVEIQIRTHEMQEFAENGV
ncbi:MAG: GTP pyrophosphokinase (EC, (p)ppGpp synthetase I, partial [uncultured Thiotrichaceae bacterium]